MADAPRFRFWWGRERGNSILTMRRSDWNSLVGHFGEPVEVDVLKTPLAGVARVSSVVASVAHQFDSATAKFSVFRYDDADLPTPINLDDYDVWHDLAGHPRLPQMIHAASTSDNENFSNVLPRERLFVKRSPGPDHWLPTIPSSITVVLRKK